MHTVVSISTVSELIMYVKVIMCSRDFSVSSYVWEQSTFFHRKRFFPFLLSAFNLEFHLWRLTPRHSALAERWCFANIHHLIICWVCAVLYLCLLLVHVNKDFLGYNFFSSNFTLYFNIFVMFYNGNELSIPHLYVDYCMVFFVKL
jgi:hypothetical protein